MCHRRILPKGVRIDQPEVRSLMRTLAGTYSPQGTVRMGGIKLPAFDKHRVIENHEFHVFQSDCRYDVILGGDFLEKIGMIQGSNTKITKLTNKQHRKVQI